MQGGRPSESSSPFPSSPATAGRPDLPGTVIARESRDDVIDVLLMDLLIQAQNCVRAFGDFHLAISASERVERVLVRMMLDIETRGLPWKRTHLWMVDDCIVDVDDDRSRAKRMREILVEHSDIPVDQVHGIMVASDDPGGEYQAELREALGWREKGQDRLDYALLSLADGGPVAEALAGRRRVASGGDADLVLTRPWKDRDGVEWYGLSPRMISATRLIAVLASGADVRGDVAAIAEARRLGGEKTAIGGITPIGGEMRWYVDAAASGDAVEGSADPGGRRERGSH